MTDLMSIVAENLGGKVIFPEVWHKEEGTLDWVKMYVGTLLFPEEVTEEVFNKEVREVTKNDIHTSCSCLHDCCGHWFLNSVRAFDQKATKSIYSPEPGSVFLVQEEWSRNY